jgi:hypothetical protein
MPVANNCYTKLFIMNPSIASPETIKKESPIRIKVNEPVDQIAPNFFLICGILSSLLYIAMNIFVPMFNEGYDIASQTVSELSAIGAPTRSKWVLLAILYSVLVVAFGYGVSKSARAKRPLRVAGTLIVVYAVIGLFWPPMHTREVLAAGGRTLTDTLHIVWAMVTVPLMLIVIGYGAAAFGKLFRLYSIISIIVLLVFGALTGMASPQMEANVATPWIGVWERISIGAYMLWIIVFTLAVLRKEKNSDENFSNAP